MRYNMHYKGALCTFFEEWFSFQKVDLLSTSEGCTFVFFSTEMGIDFFVLVFLLRSGGHHTATHPRMDPRCAGHSVALLCGNSFSVPELW